jgi:signal peptidase II
MTETDPKTSGADDKPSVGAWIQLAVISIFWLVADQVTKFLAVKHLTFAFENAHARTLSEEIGVFVHRHHLTVETKPAYHFIREFWSHRYAENPGAAWSLLANAPEKFRATFFMVVSFLAIGLIAWYYSKLKSDQKLLRLALSLVMGGALGNLLDRVMRSYVIDFIDWHLNDPTWLTRWHWPTFNVADTGISLGVALIALDTLQTWWAERQAAAAKGTGRLRTEGSHASNSL